MAVFRPQNLATGMASPVPQQTIQPVNRQGAIPQAAATPQAAPAPQQPRRYSAQQVFGNDFSGGMLPYGLSTPGNNQSQVGTLNALGQFLGTPGAVKTPFQQETESGSITTEGYSASPELLEKLKTGGYQFGVDTSGRHPMMGVYDPSGQQLGRDFSIGDTGSSFDAFAEKAVPIALALLAGGTFSGMIPGTGGAAAGLGGANTGLAGGLGTFGGEAAGLATLGGEATAFGGLGELGALAAGAPTQTAFGSFTLPGAGAAASMAGPGGLAGLPGFEAAPLPGSEGFSFANTAATGATPDPFVFNAAADSQAFNQAAGITGSQAASAATVPPTVNLGSLGGTMSTAGGLTGALQSFIADPANAIKNAGSSVLNFAQENPRIASLGLGAAAQLAGGSPDLPSALSAGGGASGSNSQLIDALTQQLYGQGGSLSGMPDYSGLPGLKTDAGDLNTLNQEAINAAYSQQTRLLDPQFARDQQAMEARLAEQGFVPGTPGYDRAMTLFNESRNQAYGGARDSSILQGYQIGQGDARNALSEAELNNSASREALSQLLAKRNQPLNELASLRSGQQIDYNNQLDRYNAEVSSSNSRNQALSQLAMALGMYLG